MYGMLFTAFSDGQKLATSSNLLHYSLFLSIHSYDGYPSFGILDRTFVQLCAECDFTSYYPQTFYPFKCPLSVNLARRQQHQTQPRILLNSTNIRIRISDSPLDTFRLQRGLNPRRLLVAAPYGPLQYVVEVYSMKISRLLENGP